jgi:SAM-dependent methyltransferase
MVEYELTPVNAECPVCSHNGCHRLYSVSSEKAAQHFVLREVNPDRHAGLNRHIRKLWGQNHCSILRCAGCQFAFASPLTAGDADFYALAYSFGAEKYPREKWEYDEAFRRLSHRRGRPNRFLEIGAGSGAFVSRLIPDFIEPSDAVCIEYSQNGAAALRSLGVQCLNQDVRSSPALDGRQFDIICMFQVLEHLADLDRLFTRLGQLAAPGCDIFIAVPNPRRSEFQELNGAILDMPPNHVGRWTPRSFEVIGKKFGFSLRYCATNRSQPFMDKAKRFVKFTYLHRAQSRTLANRVEQMSDRRIKMLFRVFVAGLYACQKRSAVFKCMNRNLGDALLVHFQKR